MPEALRSEEQWVVFGPSLAALVLAERLGSSRRKVVLLNPGRSWGGLFAGLPIGSRMFDTGMTNFEFELFGEPDADLQRYDPDRKGDLVKYVQFVRDYVGCFATVHEVPAPEMTWGGRRYPDLMLTNEFAVLRGLPTELQRQMVVELEEILRRPNPLHPRLKTHADSELARRPFAAVSLANHGETFHRTFVEPLFQKVLGVPSGEVPGTFHRSGWAPLFHPETLLSQFGASPQVLKRTVFHYPDDAHFGAFIRRIVERVRTLPSVQVFDGVTEVRVDRANRSVRTAQGEFAFDRLAWGGDLRQLAAQVAPREAPREAPAEALVPDTHRASLELFLLQVRRDAVYQSFSVLLDPARESPYYRLTDQTVCALRDEAFHQIILECNSKSWNADPRSEPEKLAAALARYGIDPVGVVETTHRTFAGALAIPSLERMRQFTAMRTAVQAAIPGIELIGPSSGYISVTLNDHVIQALKIAQREGAVA